MRLAVFLAGRVRDVFEGLQGLLPSTVSDFYRLHDIGCV